MQDFVTYNPNGIPIKLPLIELLKKNFNVSVNRPLSDFCLIAVQHIQGSTIPLIEALGESGILFHNMYLVSKSYSMHPVSFNHLLQLGCNISNNEQMQDYRQPYEHESENNIRSAINIFLANNNKNIKCLLLDEGGKAIRLVHTEYQKIANNFFCVEQTTRGINEVKDLFLQCPVVNVARSSAKKQLEGPLIAHSMAKSIVANLQTWQHIEIPTTKNFLIIGFGVIGKLLANILRSEGFNIVIFDNNPEITQEAINEGFSITANINESIGNFPIILGCTGTNCLANVNFRNLHENVLLINCASSDIEFAAWELRQNAEIVCSRVLLDKHASLYHPWLNLYYGIKDGRHYYLANGGFPINFSGELDPIDPNKFQLTRALIFLGILQAASEKVKGLVQLDPKGEALLTNEFIKLS